MEPERALSLPKGVHSALLPLPRRWDAGQYLPRALNPVHLPLELVSLQDDQGVAHDDDS